MFYAGHWSGYLVINRPSWNKGFRGSHDIIRNNDLKFHLKSIIKNNNSLKQWKKFINELYIQGVPKKSIPFEMKPLFEFEFECLITMLK